MDTQTDLPARPTHLLRSIGELLQAVPYLLGFRPRESLVLVGLADGVLVVTARLDVAAVSESVDSAISAMANGGTTSILAAVYAPPPVSARLPIAGAVRAAAEERGCEVFDVVLCDDGRWWSLDCDSPLCCPPDGRPLPDTPSPFTAAATYDGVVVLPERADLAAQLEPVPECERAGLDPLIAAAEHAGVRAALDGGLGRHERSVKRALFAAARAVEQTAEGGWCPPEDETVARFGVALSVTDLRDSVWLAIDDGRLDGRPLWLELGRRLPPPYSAAPLFLYGWACWRAGNATLAGMAVDRVLDSDPAYSAGELLYTAVAYGLDPRRVPRLRSRALL